MKKYTVYILAASILCAHVESKSMFEAAIVICIGWFGGTHYWNVTSKKEFNKLNLKMDQMQTTLRQAMNDHKDEVVSEIKQQLEELKTQSAGLRKEDIDAFNSKFATLEVLFQASQSSIQEHLNKLAEINREQSEKHNAQHAQLGSRVDGLHRSTSVLQERVTELGTTVVNENDATRREVRKQLADHQEQSAQQLKQHKKELTEQVFTIVGENALKTRECLTNRLDQESEQRTKAFDDLKKEFASNIGVSEEKMTGIVSRSEGVLSGQIKVVNMRIQEFENELKIAKEEEKVFIVSQMTAFQEESQRQLNEYLGAFDGWKESCEKRLRKVENELKNGQQATNTALEKHGSLILKLQDDNKLLRQLIEEQNKKLDQQSEQFMNIMALLQRSVDLGEENKREHEKTRDQSARQHEETGCQIEQAKQVVVKGSKRSNRSLLNISHHNQAPEGVASFYLSDLNKSFNLNDGQVDALSKGNFGNSMPSHNSGLLTYHNDEGKH